MVTRATDCDGKRIPIYPISCLSGVVYRGCAGPESVWLICIWTFEGQRRQASGPIGGKCRGGTCQWI